MIHKKISIFALALCAFAQIAQADTIVVTNGPYQVSYTDYVAVGTVEGLMATTLKITNTSALDANNPFTFNGQIGINGMLHHEQFASPFPPFAQTPTATQLTSGGSLIDSHFVRPAALTISAETEPLIDDGTSAEPGQFAGRTGFGGPLSANIALGTGADPPPAMIDIAYLVVKNSSIDFNFVVASATGGAGEVALQGVVPAPGGGPENTQPLIGDLGPLVGDMSLNGNVPTIVSGTPTAEDNQLPGIPLAWVLLSSDPANPGAPAIAPTVNATSGLFEWNVNGSKQGTYKFTYQATDNGLPGTGGPLSDTGMVTVEVIVPEPATLTLFSLAMVGLVGLARRR